MITDLTADGPVTFEIDSLNRLAWFGRKLAAKQAELAALDDSYQAARRELQRDLDAFKSWFDPQAERFVRIQLEAASGQAKTLRTLGGAFSFRTVPGGLRKNDDDLVMTWARQSAPELLRQTIKVDVPVEGLRRHWQATGEIPPGCEVAADREVFGHKIEKSTGPAHEDQGG